MDNGAARLLMVHIVKDAIKEYSTLMHKLETGGYVNAKRYYELREFFQSEWFFAISGGIDGNVLLNKMDNIIIAPRKPRKKPVKRAYTPEEINKMLELRKNGLTYAQIGDAMNRSTTSIFKKFERLKEGI